MDSISRWRQRINQLCKIRGHLESQLMKPKQMRIGSVVKQYMFCGKASCACHREPQKKHGPYYYLSYKEKGKSRYKYLGKATSAEVERARNYQVFQRGMAQLGRMHREIIDLLWKIGETKMKEADEE
jgi:Family of unknown function (DUF6788)